MAHKQAKKPRLPGVYRMSSLANMAGFAEVTIGVLMMFLFDPTKPPHTQNPLPYSIGGLQGIMLCFGGFMILLVTFASMFMSMNPERFYKGPWQRFVSLPALLLFAWASYFWVPRMIEQFMTTDARGKPLPQGVVQGMHAWYAEYGVVMYLNTVIVSVFFITLVYYAFKVWRRKNY